MSLPIHRWLARLNALGPYVWRRSRKPNSAWVGASLEGQFGDGGN
jgi:hypothetical protein